MKFRRAAGSANLARDAPPAIIVEIGDNYARAFTREGLGGCLPDAGARAGDERYLIREPHPAFCLRCQIPRNEWVL
jgi:hypothetical protein